MIDNFLPFSLIDDSLKLKIEQKRILKDFHYSSKRVKLQVGHG